MGDIRLAPGAESALADQEETNMARTNTVVLAFLAISVTISSSVFAQKTEIRPVRVYVFTALSESGFVDADSKDRTDSVEDLRKYLKGKKKTVVIVDDQSAAELSLEVKGRDMVLTGGTSVGTDPVFGGVKNSADRTGTLHTVLTVGDYSTAIVGEGGHMGMVWSIAAKEVAGKVDTWIKDNAQRIPRR